MRSTQYIWLGLTVLIGILWVFIIQNWIFLNLFSALLGQNLNVFLPQISSPSFTILWISCTIALLFWIFTTLNGKPRNAAEVKSMQPRWWISTILLVLLVGSLSCSLLC